MIINIKKLQFKYFNKIGINNMNDIEKVSHLLQQGENNAVEFKSRKTHVDSVAREVTAFANSGGGVILLGVDDDGSVEGLDDSCNWEERVANITRHNIIPPIICNYREVVIKGKLIGFIDVPKGKDRPYQTNRSQFVIRVGSTSRMATQGELMRLFQHAGMFHFDLTGIEKTDVSALNLTKIADYFQRYDVDITQEDDQKILLQNTDILTEEGKITIAGMLVFGLQPQRFLRNASISFAHYAGTEPDTELIDHQVIEGTLDYQIETSMAVIRNNLQNPSIVKGARRISRKTSWPEKVYRELMVNACIHRNYAISGSRIRILLFSDRIEFISPGRLPNTVTIEKLKQGVSFAVNPVILKFMENLRYIDKLGRGLPMVWNESKKTGLQAVFEEIGEEFRVTLEI